MKENHTLSSGIAVADEKRLGSDSGQMPSVGFSPALLQQLRDGDPRAFETLYLHYSDSLHDFVSALIRNQEDAREITQEIFASLWEKRATIDPRRNIRGLLYTSARNQCLNYFDHKKVIDKYNLLAPHLADSALPSDEIVIARETEMLVRLAVEAMPEQRRRIFTMSRYEEMSIEQIAERLGLSRKTVENHLTDANRDLRGVIALFLLLVLQ